MDTLSDSYIPIYCQSRVLILGCGNTLFGDDGFGPAVIEHLTENYPMPDEVCVLDAGTGIRDPLCTVALYPVRPKKLIIVDTADIGRDPGQMVLASIEDMVTAKAGSLSLQELPTTSLLKDLKD